MPNTDMLNRRLDRASPEDILAWAWETLRPDVAASTSFQSQSAVLLHMISRVCPEMPVLFIDTGFHFPETLVFAEEMRVRFGLRLKVVRPAVGRTELARMHGEALYRRDPDLCCHIHKVEPMERELAALRGWVSGVRGDQTDHRKRMRVVEARPAGLLEIHPLIRWTNRHMAEYMRRYRLPSHPLADKRYPSIGCAPCTRPVSEGEHDRAGRWWGSGKTECGLHCAARRRRERSVQPGGET